MSWEDLDDSLLRLTYREKSSQKYFGKIVMFDLDGTIVKPISGKVHPQNASDWKWWSDNVIPKFQIIAKSCTIIIITNQAGYKNHPEVLERIEEIFKQLYGACSPLYIEIYIAIDNDIYRKPNTTIFEKYIWPKITKLNTILYVGDAAGREDDFSDSDRKFAFNIHLFLRYKEADGQIKFATPEEYFNGS